MKDKPPARPEEIPLQSPPIRIWRLGDLCETVEGPVSEPVAKFLFLHEGLMIGLVEAGVVGATYRGALHRLERGALIVVQPEQVIGFDPIRGVSEPSRICVHCPTEVLQKVTNEIAGQRKAMQIFSESVRSDPHLATLVRKFQRSLELPASLLERSSRFDELLTGVIRAYASPMWRELKPESALVRRMRTRLKHVSSAAKSCLRKACPSLARRSKSASSIRVISRITSNGC